MKIQIFQINVNDGRREADPEAVRTLADSISKVGLLNPITVDKDYTLIAGLHRLEAVKLLGWSEIECNVSSLEGLSAELAEIDENVVRKGLSPVEFNDLLLRRKEIYEMLHPQSKHGGDRKSDEIKRPKWPLDSEKSFVDDTAEKTGKGKRTIRRQIQIAKNLTPEAKDVLRGAGNHITQKDTLMLSRRPSDQQADAARQLAEETINSAGKRRPVPAAQGSKKKEGAELLSATSQSAPPPEAPAALAPPPALRESYYATTRDSIDDLKNPDKDRTCTPETFVASFSLCLGRFRQSIETYTGPAYESALPALTPEHLDRLRREIQSVCTTLDNLYRQIERSLRT